MCLPAGFKIATWGTSIDFHFFHDQQSLCCVLSEESDRFLSCIEVLNHSSAADNKLYYMKQLFHVVLI